MDIKQVLNPTKEIEVEIGGEKVTARYYPGRVNGDTEAKQQRAAAKARERVEALVAAEEAGDELPEFPDEPSALAIFAAETIAETGLTEAGVELLPCPDLFQRLGPAITKAYVDAIWADIYPPLIRRRKPSSSSPSAVTPESSGPTSQIPS